MQCATLAVDIFFSFFLGFCFQYFVRGEGVVSPDAVQGRWYVVAPSYYGDSR